MTWLMLSTAIGFLAFALLLVVWSPGQPAPLVGRNNQLISGSISERVFINVNGTRQGMFIQSVDRSNPVILFLHGGPGIPTFFLNTTYPTGLEQDFTVVWWEQRGAGLSYSHDIPTDSMTTKQLIADTVTVTNYLRQRFGQDKIYLLGHSWGSFLGIQVAAEAPELFHAYIGMAQISHQLRSEVIAHDYLLKQYRSFGDDEMVRKLEAAKVSLEEGTSDEWMSIRDEAMHKLGVGTTHDMHSVITGIFFPVWRCQAYTIREKINIWRGKALSRSFLWNEVLHTDLSTKVNQSEIPVYFFVGLHDYTANRELARQYFDRIKSPLKGFYTFQNSAHSPLFEEPLLARKILAHDVLGKTNQLADGDWSKRE